MSQHPEMGPEPEGAAVAAPRFASVWDGQESGSVRLERDLRKSLASGGLLAAYQPRIVLGSGRPVGAEALARWSHPRRGSVPPSSFIPLAERSGLISELGGWMLSAACTEAASWPNPAFVSVNVSAVQLSDGVLLDQVSRALAVSGLDPTRLEIELTESMLIDAGWETLLTLSAVRDMGVGVALDDFGTGYAGLGTLKRLPLTTLKLDRSLMHGLPDEGDDAAVVRAIVQMGHALGLDVVAEGVETARQRQFLVEIGCDQAQAFMFGRPMPGQAVADLLTIGAIP